MSVSEQQAKTIKYYVNSERGIDKERVREGWRAGEYSSN